MSAKPVGIFQVLEKDGTVHQSCPVGDQSITFGCDESCDVTIRRKKYDIKHHATLFYDKRFEKKKFDVILFSR
jgi:hypothetical protein